MPALADQVVVVTGASRGIGAACSRELASRGARVVLIARNVSALESVAADLGDRAACVAADITDSASLERAAKEAVSRFGRVDSLVCNAGVLGTGTVRTGTPEDFAAIVDTNLVGTYRTLHAFLPALVESRGYALLVSSIASSLGLGGQSAYAASKSGLEMLAHTLRMELRHLGVKVGAIHPWFVDTDMLGEAEQAIPSFERFRARFAPLARIPGPLGLAGATLTADECADMMADMVAGRIRRRHAPRSAGLLAFCRPGLNSGFGEAVQQLMFGHIMREIDAETRR